MTTPERHDLARGIPVTALAPGEMIEGTFEGQRVLLARVGESFHAVGGECTHYGAPLCEGLLRGTTVLCPWHHARFELTSGRAVGPPALSDLPRFRVEEEGGRVRVTGLLPQPRARSRPATCPSSVVIVGAGAAGAVAAETLRDEGFDGPVTLLEGETTGPVDRPNLSKDYLAGHAPEEWLPLRPEDFYREQGIDVRLEARVEAIDPGKRTATLASGETFEWDALLLTLGATPRALPVPGADLPHVFTLRSLRDARAIIAAAGSGGRAVVVGASFIGLEVAAALRARKLEVDVVAPESTPMEHVLGPGLAAFIHDLHEQNGVRFHLGRTLERVERHGVTLSDASSISADLVVVGIGVQPNTQLAQAAGLACDHGILVDELLRASAPGVWAAGDVARWRDATTGNRVRFEHWVLAQQQGRLVARNMLGAREPFHAVPFFWSRHYEASVHYVGHAPEWDAADEIGDPRHGQGAVLLRRGGQVRAVASVGDPRVSLEAELVLERGDQQEALEWERQLRDQA